MPEQGLWDSYIRSRKLHPKELANEEYCVRLRNTVDFATYRFNVAVGNFTLEIKKTIKELLT